MVGNSTPVFFVRRRTGLCLGLAVLASVAVARSEITVFFKEAFYQGNVQLNWQSFPGFSPTRVTAIASKQAPDGDGWVGRISNGTFGGFAALSYAGRPDLSDYSVEAWIFTTVTSDEKGPLNGIAIRVDPVEERFYRLASHFTAEARLTLAYVGRDTNNFPVYLKSWPASSLPGGGPRQSSWNKMKLTASGDSIRAYWNGQELPGSPIRDNRIARGYFGVYANFVGGRQIAETLVDALRVEEEVK
jgi:hypothetical protein